MTEKAKNLTQESIVIFSKKTNERSTFVEITTCKLTKELFAEVRMESGHHFDDVRINDKLTMKVEFIDFDALASLLEKRESAHRPVYVFVLPSFEA